MLIMEENVFYTINPFNQQKIQSYSYTSSSQFSEILQQSQVAFKAWSAMDIVERKNKLARFKLELAQKKSEIVISMSREMGKPILQANTEIEKSIQLIDYCLSMDDALFKEERHKHHIVLKNPLGVIYGIMPWNFPVWQALRFALPAMLAGNTILLKPADNVAGTALLLNETFQRGLGIPGVFTTLLLTSTQSDALIAHEEIRGVSFTGSTRVGKEIAKVAGAHLKKCVLELGGNDAYIICEDADVQIAAQKLYQGRILNSGQSCISAKRLFVHESVHDDFLKHLTHLLKDIQFGDPLLQKNLMGPLARRDLVDHLQDQVNVAVAQGAEIFFQKEFPKELNTGNFFAPTVLINIPKNSISHFDEFFGPVFSISKFQTEADAVQLANQSPYGLGGAVFSRDRNRAWFLANQLETGSVALNDYLKSAPERPFGGIKQSGYGSELGVPGFFEFIHHKVIVIS